MLTSYVVLNPAIDYIDAIDAVRFLSRNGFEIANEEPISLDRFRKVMEIHGSSDAYKRTFKLETEERWIGTKKGKTGMDIPKGGYELPSTLEAAVCDLIILFEAFLVFQKEAKHMDMKRNQRRLSQYGFEILNQNKRFSGKTICIAGCSILYENVFGLQMFPYIAEVTPQEPSKVRMPEGLYLPQALSAPFPVVTS